MKESGKRRWWALGAMSLAVLAWGVDGTVLSVALPTLSKALHASESDLQWFSSGYFLVLAAAMLPAGLLGDRYGRKKVLVSLLGPLRRRVGGLRLFDLRGRVHGRPGARRPGRGRADRHGASPPSRCCSPKQERPKAVGSDVGGHLRGLPDRAHPRWLAAHQLLVGLGVPDQRAGRRGRLGRRRRPGAGVPRRTAPGPGPRRGGGLGRRPGGRHLRADQGGPGRLGQPRRPGPDGRPVWCCWSASSPGNAA